MKSLAIEITFLIFSTILHLSISASDRPLLEDKQVANFYDTAELVGHEPLEENAMEKKAHVFRYGKRAPSVFRYGKRGQSLFRYGKRADAIDDSAFDTEDYPDQLFPKRIFRYGKRDDASMENWREMEDMEADKRIFRYGKRLVKRSVDEELQKNAANERANQRDIEAIAQLI